MKKFRIHYFEHVPYEGLGYIKTWVNNHNHKLSSTKFHEPFKLPKLSNFDWLIIMGGPMGVYDYKKFPWLLKEKEFISKAIKANKVVIGICLGAQLIAAALGAKVYQNIKKEIGWFELTKTEDSKKNSIVGNMPEKFVSFHWHGDTFDLPKGAVNLFKSENCLNQAFLYRDLVLGIQFHLEITPKALKGMVENLNKELIADDFVQNEKKILNELRFYENSNNYLVSILNNFY